MHFAVLLLIYDPFFMEEESLFGGGGENEILPLFPRRFDSLIIGP